MPRRRLQRRSNKQFASQTLGLADLFSTPFGQSGYTSYAPTAEEALLLGLLSSPNSPKRKKPTSRLDDPPSATKPRLDVQLPTSNTNTQTDTDEDDMSRGTDNVGVRRFNYKVVNPVPRRMLTASYKPFYRKSDFSQNRVTGTAGVRTFTSLFQATHSGVDAFAAAAILAEIGKTASSAPNYNIPCLIQAYNTKIWITNVCNFPAECIIYEVMPKLKHSYAPISAILDGIDYQGGTATTYLQPDQPIQDSPNFKESWIVKQAKRFFMAPGETIIYYSTRILNARWDYQDNISIGTTYHPKYTPGVIMACQGASVTNDSTLKSAASASLNSTAFNTVIRYDVIIKVGDETQVELIVPPTAPLPTTFANAEEGINKDSDTVVTFVTA